MPFPFSILRTHALKLLCRCDAGWSQRSPMREWGQIRTAIAAAPSPGMSVMLDHFHVVCFQKSSLDQKQSRQCRVVQWVVRGARDMQWISRFAKDQDQRSWLLHQATKTVGFDHLLVHDSHFLALHTAYIVTLCRMSRYSSTSYCHACLMSSCITHITGLCQVQHACTDAKLVLLCMFHVICMRVAHSSDCLYLLLGGF